MLGSEAVSIWSSHSPMASCPQTVRISYCGSRLAVTSVCAQPYRHNPSDLSNNFRGRNSGGPAPSRESDRSQFLDRCIIAACTSKEAGNFFGVWPHRATRTERSSFAQLSYLGPKHPFIPMSPNPGNTHRLACKLR